MKPDRKTAIAAQFDAADHYDQAARVQRRCATQLTQHIATATAQHPPRRILELGCGTGFLSAQLLTIFPQATLCATDLAPAMLQRTRARLGDDKRVSYRLMDGEHPETDWAEPAHPPFDLITSSLCWQWFTDRPKALQRLCALLAPGGKLMVSTLLEHSLQEWRESCHATQTVCGVPIYPSRTQLEREWPDGGTGHWTDSILTDSVPSARIFLRELRQIGASLPQEGHTTLQGQSLRRAIRWFDDHHRTVRYHIGYGLFEKASL